MRSSIFTACSTRHPEVIRRISALKPSSSIPLDIANNTPQGELIVTRQRKAFTLIEILLVISIILVLMGMTLIGFRYIGRNGKIQTTKTSLETMKSMLAELQATKGGMDPVKAFYVNAIPSPKLTNSYPHAFPPLGSGGGTVTPVEAPGNGLPGAERSVSDDEYSATNQIRFGNDSGKMVDAITATQVVMRRVL